jgi:hypothetical protein
VIRRDQDNFDRPDENPVAGFFLTAPGGSACEIVGNRVRGTTVGGGGSDMRSTLPMSANQTSTIRVRTFSASAAGQGQARAWARLQSGAYSGYVSIVGGGSFGTVSCTLFRVTAFSFVSIASGSTATLSADSTVSCDCQGTTIRMLVDGAQIYSVTDANFTSGFPGFGIFVDTGNALSTVELDDFEASATHFPVVKGSAVTLGTTATAAPVINLPSALRSDTILVAMIRVAVAGVIGWPAGWNELVDASPDGADDQIGIAWKQTLGTEGATATLSCTSAKFSALVWEIYGASISQPPQLSTVAIGTDAAPNPTTVTPTGGSKDYLILWLGSWEGEQTSPPAAGPTNYSGLIGADSGTAGVVTTNTRVASAWREVTGSSEDPGSLTISVADDWAAYAMAIHPPVWIPPLTIKLTAVAHSFNW